MCWFCHENLNVDHTLQVSGDWWWLWWWRHWWATWRQSLTAPVPCSPLMCMADSEQRLQLGNSWLWEGTFVFLWSGFKGVCYRHSFDDFKLFNGLPSLCFCIFVHFLCYLMANEFFLFFLMWFCRIMVAILTGIGILWIPVVQNVQGGQLFLYIQAVSAYFSPPIAALYLIAILWTKATEKVCCKAFLCTLHRKTMHTINHQCIALCLNLDLLHKLMELSRNSVYTPPVACCY